MEEFTKDDFELDSEITSRLLTEIRNKYMKVNGGIKKQANGQIMSLPILKCTNLPTKRHFRLDLGFLAEKEEKGSQSHC